MEAHYDRSASSVNISYNEVANAHLARIRGIGPSDNEDSVTEAVRLYDNELKELAETASSIATQRNAVAHNPRIPPEILSRILRHVIDLYPAIHDDPSPEEWISSYRKVVGIQLPGWLPLSQVCRLWRDLLFRDPRLWTHMTYATSMKWMKEGLARTKDLPLTLHRYIPRGYAPWKRNLEEFEVINEHMFHIRELEVIVNPGSMVFGIPLTNPAPLLESLKLSRYRIGIPEERVLDPEQESLVDPLSNDLFAWTVPALRRLVLSGYTIDWIMSPLITPSIIHFELRLPLSGIVQLHHVDPDFQDVTAPLAEPSRDQLFRCLCRMPMLEVLNLQNVWPVAAEDDPWPPRSRWPELAHLRSLTLTGDLMSCGGFLEHVRIPTSASIRVSCFFDKPDPWDDHLNMPDLVTMLPAYISRLSTGRRIFAAAFEFTTSERGVGMKLWRNEAENPLVPEREPFATFIFVPTTTFMAAVLPMLHHLIPRLHFPDLRVLSISFRFSRSRRTREFRATVEVLTQLLVHFCGAQHLIFNMRAADVLFQILEVAIAPPEPQGGSKDRIPAELVRSFREFDTISLLDTECGASAKAHEILEQVSVSSHIPNATFFEAFTSNLVALRQTGRLQSLNVNREDLEDWKSRLEGAVPVQLVPVEMQRYIDEQ